MDIDVERLKELIAQREAIDVEIAAIAGGIPRERKPVKCSKCGNEGHTARNCPDKLPQNTP